MYWVQSAGELLLDLSYQVFLNLQQMIDAYEKNGFDMLLTAFNDAASLEKITGLDKLAAEMDASLENSNWEEADEDDDF